MTPPLSRWLVALAALLLCPALARAQLDPSWREPFEPYRIADNLYYVGTRGISSFLLVGSQGDILLDTGLEQNVPLVRASIEKLGFQLSDIKIMLSSHAHFDHVGGHAEMQRLSGAKVMALGDDAESIATGVDLSALGGAGWKPVKVERVLKDGDIVSLGDLSLTAHHTPGHTKGCTTWTTQVQLDGERRSVVFIGGTSINAGVVLQGNPRHPKIAEDYAHTFQVLKQLDADLFLAQHPPMFGMEGKVKRLLAGEKPSPFLDRAGYAAFVGGQEERYRAQLEKERGAGASHE